MSSNNKQSGFTVWIVLIILVATIVGATGYYVWQNNKSDQPVTSPQKTAIDTSESTEKTPEQQTTPQQSDTTEYLRIKEWGIRMKTSDLTKDAKYLIVSDNTVSLSTETYGRLDKKCEVSKDLLTGVLVRGKAGYDISPTSDGSLLIEDFEYSIKVGQYYYAYIGPQAPCATPTDENVKVMNLYQSAIKELTQSIEAI